MAELSDTEERYVMKMHELVNHIADDFRTRAKERTFGSFSPSEEDLQKLFPKCLDRDSATQLCLPGDYSQSYG